MPTRAERSLTAGTGPSAVTPRRSTTARMSVHMPTEDKLGIPDHLLDMVCIPGYVELSDDTTTTSGVVVAIATADAGEYVDGHPLSPGVSDNDDPVE
jgi:hypothetical protein